MEKHFFLWTWVALCMSLKSPHLSRVPILTQPDSGRQPRETGGLGIEDAHAQFAGPAAYLLSGIQDLRNVWTGASASPLDISLSPLVPRAAVRMQSRGGCLQAEPTGPQRQEGHLCRRQASHIAPLLQVHFKGNSCFSSLKEATKPNFSNFKILDFFTFKFLSALSKSKQG